jgi:hypothetical protein
MSRAAEAMRRLGAPYCPRCESLGTPAIRIVEFETNTLRQVCEDCAKQIEVLNEQHMTRQTASAEESRLRREAVRDITRASASGYIAASQGMLDDVKEAMRSWTIGSGLFGRSRD